MEDDMVFLPSHGIDMMQQSSSRTPPDDLDMEMLSAYEDALEDSETELKQLCEDAARHLKRDRRPRAQGILLAPVVRTARPKRSSSSEHSSIEKVEGFRSRRSINRRRPTKNNGSDGSEEEYRMVNFAFQEVTHYPVLVQINQQLQLLSRQLYDIESTNALQLKIIAQLIGKLIKSRKRPWFSFSKVIRFLPIALCVICWPFVARSIYLWIIKRRHALSVLRYL